MLIVDLLVALRSLVVARLLWSDGHAHIVARAPHTRPRQRPLTRTGLVPHRPQQRLAANRDDQDAQDPGHELRWRRGLARLEDVVEEQEVHSEEPENQKDIRDAPHAWIVDRKHRGSTLPWAGVRECDPIVRLKTDAHVTAGKSEGGRPLAPRPRMRQRSGMSLEQNSSQEGLGSYRPAIRQDVQGASRTAYSTACARATTAAIGLADPKKTQTLTYDPERQVEADQRETRPLVVFPSKLGVTRERTIRSGRVRNSQAGGDGSQERVRWMMIPFERSFAIVRFGGSWFGASA